MLSLVLLGGLMADMGPMLPLFRSSTTLANVRRNVEAINLRSIGQAMLTEESVHPGTLTAGDLSDVYALAARLARYGDMTDPKLWFSRLDPMLPQELPASILDPAQDKASATLRPQFQGAPLAFAVALFPAGTNFAKLPPTTPLAWTRGLRPDGMWRDDSPYGDWGGHIVFVNGTTQTFPRGIKRKLTAFGTAKLTDSILETLPPGTRVSEYIPPPGSPLASKVARSEWLADVGYTLGMIGLFVLPPLLIIVYSVRTLAQGRGSLVGHVFVILLCLVVLGLFL